MTIKMMKMTSLMERERMMKTKLKKGLMLKEKVQGAVKTMMMRSLMKTNT